LRVKSVRFLQPEIDVGISSSLLFAKSAIDKLLNPPIVSGKFLSSFVSSHNSRNFVSFPKSSGRLSISFSPRSRYCSDSRWQMLSGRQLIIFSRASRHSSVFKSPMLSGKRSKDTALIRKCFRLYK